MAKIYTVQYGNQIYELEGPDDATPQQLEAAIAATQKPAAPAPAPAPAEAPPSVGERIGGAITSTVSDMGQGKEALGIVDAGATFASGLLGTAASGLVGLGSLAIGRSGEDTAQTVKAVSDFLTWSPKTEIAQAFFRDVSPLLEWVDTKVKDVSSAGGRASPGVSTAVETGANALAMLLGPGAVKTSVVAGMEAGSKAGLTAGIKAAAKTAVRESTPYQIHANEAARRAQAKAIEATAKDLQEAARQVGIELRLDRIHRTVKEVANGRAADVRGGGFKLLSDKLTSQYLKDKAAANQKWTDFRAINHYADISWAEGMVRPLAEELANKGFKIESPIIQETLNDLRLLNKRVVTKVNPEGTGYLTVPDTWKIKRQSLNELQAIRERIRKRGVEARGTPDGEAIATIGKRFDEMLDAQFRADAQKGIDAPWEAWKDARKTWESYKDRWNAFKVVKDIIKDPAMTPQKLANEIIGTSSMLGSKQSSRIYEHIMQLTGNDKNIKMAIEASVMYDLVKPLIENPDAKPGAYGQVANNIRRFRKENPELIVAMGMDDNMLRAIQHGARAAEHTKLSEGLSLAETLIQGTTRHLVGHEIAQAGFRVRLSEKIINRILKKDATSHKEMLKEFAGIDQTPISSKISQEQAMGAIIRGEMANQYQNFGEWGDTE